MYDNYVGIDIAAATFTAAWQTANEWYDTTLDQRRSDYARLVHRLRQVASPDKTLVVLEVTGTYWLALAWFLHEAGFVVSAIAPTQANLYARLERQQAKTDRIDARLLADFARDRHPDAWTPPPAISDQLQQRLSRRNDLLAMKNEEANRLHALQRHPRAEGSVLECLERHIAYLQAEIDVLDRELTQLLAADHEWSTAARRLQTIPGIGPIVAAWILVATQCFVHCQTPDQAAAFAGLVPYRRESGSSRRGYRPVGRGGHAALRTALFMAALSAAQVNPCVQPVYQRLLARGKPHKVARVACARKLIRIAWAVVVKERDFDPTFAHLPEFVALGT
jgi:transposase